MKDRFTEAVSELPEKSPFVCTTCESHRIPKERTPSTDTGGDGLHDRFSDAVRESGDKSAFICESCSH